LVNILKMGNAIRLTCLSALIIPMSSDSGQITHFKVTVDNTFNSIRWLKIEEDAISKWNAYLGDTEIERWYNKKAASKTGLEKIANQLALARAMNRIERSFVNYLELKSMGL